MDTLSDNSCFYFHNWLVKNILYIYTRKPRPVVGMYNVFIWRKQGQFIKHIFITDWTKISLYKDVKPSVNPVDAMIMAQNLTLLQYKTHCVGARHSFVVWPLPHICRLRNPIQWRNNSYHLPLGGHVLLITLEFTKDCWTSSVQDVQFIKKSCWHF